MVNGGFIAHHLPRIRYLGGPFLRHPRIVTVTFGGDDPEWVARLERFGETITRSSWWRTVSKGYCARTSDCIGDGRPGQAVRLDDLLAEEVRAVELSALLERHARSGRFGELDRDTLLLLYLPAGVQLTDAYAGRYCTRGPRAFHRALRFDGRRLPYAVMPRCGDEAAVTTTASQELLEMATNPDTARRGFAFERGSATLGFTAAGVEAGDPCSFLTLGKRQTTEGDFVVQRAWSNPAASSGHDPCVPAPPSRPHLALVPAEPMVRLTEEGASATIGLKAAADQPVAEWTVSAIDLTGSQEDEHYVDVSLDRTSVAPGDTATLTVTVRKRSPKRLSIVGLVSTLDGESSLWPLAVSMD